MKKLSLTAVLIVFVFSFCYPMVPMVHCSSANQEFTGLTCNCCSGADNTCAYLCSKCNHHTRSDDTVWLYETLLSTFSFSVPFQPVRLTGEKSIAFVTRYREVPYKPPET